MAFLLHDDFYDEDGRAYQPEVSVERPEEYPAPSLEECRSDPSALVDFALTRWFLEENVVSALREHDAFQLLTVVSAVVENRPSPQIEARAYEIAAESIGPVAGDWVRRRWEVASIEVLFELSFASARCLPFPEGHKRVTQALASVPRKHLPDAAAGLAWFQSPATLDWIESNVGSPVVESWGRLAAVSRLSWAIARKWLLSGRPLNLVALDALISTVHYNTPLLKRLSPRLNEPPIHSEFLQALSQHRDNDSAPRVEKAVDYCIANAALIIQATGRESTGAEDT